MGGGGPVPPRPPSSVHPGSEYPFFRLRLCVLVIISSRRLKCSFFVHVQASTNKTQYDLGVHTIDLDMLKGLACWV